MEFRHVKLIITERNSNIFFDTKTLSSTRKKKKKKTKIVIVTSVLPASATTKVGRPTLAAASVILFLIAEK